MGKYLQTTYLIRNIQNTKGIPMPPLKKKKKVSQLKISIGPEQTILQSRYKNDKQVCKMCSISITIR